ncbi:MAG: hypothetical protein EHM46_03545, partial [Bacteroidetes bacterium]
QAFAGSEGLRVKWMKGSTDHILALLEKGELHIAAGGFDQSCPWKEHVYFIRPHDTITYRWGATEQAELPEDLKGKEVVVRSGSAAAAYIPGSAQVEYRDSITGTEPLVVATEDELEAYGYRLSGKSLKKIHISLAIKNGENALLEEFEKFLSSYERESDR